LKKITFILIFFISFSTLKASEENFYSFALFSIGLSFLLDDEVKEFVNSNRGETLDDLTSFFNQFGSASSIFIPIASYGYGKLFENKVLEETSKKAIFASIIAVSIVFPLKYITKRERPDKTDNYSFPSGHTALSFAIFGSYAKNIKGFKKYLLYSIPVMVGFSRIYKNHHYFSDVIAGGFIGYLSVILSEKFDKFSFERVKTIPFCDCSIKKTGLGIQYYF